MQRSVIDYNKLRNFLTIVDAGNVTAASKLLGRTQSAISQQLQALEEELGFSLLERRGGQLHLTREGSKVFQLAKPFFEQLDGGIRDVQGRLDLVNGVVKIGVTATICDFLLLPHLQEFHQQHPGISLEVILRPDETIESLLKADEIDCGFIIEFRNRDFFDATPCFAFYETLVCSTQYLSQWRESLNKTNEQYGDLTEADFIDFGTDLPNVIHWLRKNTARYRAILEGKRAVFVVEDYETVKRLVLSHVGMAMIPQYMTMNEMDIVEVFPKSNPTKVGVDFSTRKKKNFDLAANLFLQFMRTRTSNSRKK